MNSRLRRIVTRARTQQEPSRTVDALKASDNRPVDSKAIAERLMAPGGPFCMDRFVPLMVAADMARKPAVPRTRIIPMGEDFAEMLRHAITPQATPSITGSPNIRQLERSFARLSEEDREDEIARYLWSLEDESRPRTCWAPLLDQWDLGQNRVPAGLQS